MYFLECMCTVHFSPSSFRGELGLFYYFNCFKNLAEYKTTSGGGGLATKSFSDSL